MVNRENGKILEKENITGRKRLRELPRGQEHENVLDDVNRAMCVLSDKHAQ